LKRLMMTVAGLLICAQAEASDVTVAKDAAAVEACVKLDTVHSWPPYILPNADLRQMKKQAAQLGADTLLVVTRSVSSTGIAYRCKHD
jgi:hypothetical protein